MSSIAKRGCFGSIYDGWYRDVSGCVQLFLIAVKVFYYRTTLC